MDNLKEQIVYILNRKCSDDMKTKMLYDTIKRERDKYIFYTHMKTICDIADRYKISRSEAMNILNAFKLKEK